MTSSKSVEDRAQKNNNDDRRSTAHVCVSNGEIPIQIMMSKALTNQMGRTSNFQTNELFYYIFLRFCFSLKHHENGASVFSWLKSLKNGETLVKMEWSELRNVDIAKFGSHGDFLYMVNVCTRVHFRKLTQCKRIANYTVTPSTTS